MPAACQHKGPVHGGALRLVDGNGVAVIDGGIGVGLDRSPLAIVENYVKAPGRRFLNAPKRAVLDAQLTVVFQEHNPVTGRELPLALPGLKSGRVAKLARRCPGPPDGLVQVAYIGARVREHDSVFAVLPPCHPVARDQGLRRFAAGLEPHVPALPIGAQAIPNVAFREIHAGFPRPLLALAPDGGDFGDAGPFGDGAERRASLDGLQ
jgi:hypothetical protein